MNKGFAGFHREIDNHPLDVAHKAQEPVVAYLVDMELVHRVLALQVEVTFLLSFLPKTRQAQAIPD